VRTVEIESTFESWRGAARGLLAAGVAPGEVTFRDASSSRLLALPLATLAAASGTPLQLPRKFVEAVRLAAAHRDSERWDLFYRIAWRLLRENRSLLEIEVDDDVAALRKLLQAVKRDIHKMHAFVRFTEVSGENGTAFVAWYRPDHDIVRLAAPFFVERFRSMRWTIFTPDASADWDGTELRFGRGVSRLDVPQGDQLDALWRDYYAAIFNPARLNLRAMRTEMPSRFWSSMPESGLVPRLVEEASQRVGGMITAQRTALSAAPFIPPSADLEEIRSAAARCQGCLLHAPATQTVFGEGPSRSRLVLVGEQPGDAEDRQGRPFIGPAGEVLDRALEEAGIDRGAVYVTNAVKHFAYTERGKQRIHRTPRMSEVTACRPWLERELELLSPEVVVCLGATAAKSLFGAGFRITADRGQLRSTRWCEKTLATFHPSAVLRSEEAGHRDEIYAAIVSDLRFAAGLLEAAAAADG
jgi:probable DNA metabolism protein